MILDPAITIARKSALAYVGVLALTGDMLSATVEQLAMRGEAAARATRTWVPATAGEVEETVHESVAESADQVEQARSMLAKGRDRLLDALNIPTHSSMLKLNVEVAQLGAQIEELRGTLRRSKAQAKAKTAHGG